MAGLRRAGERERWVKGTTQGHLNVYPPTTMMSQWVFLKAASGKVLFQGVVMRTGSLRMPASSLTLTFYPNVFSRRVVLVPKYIFKMKLLELSFICTAIHLALHTSHLISCAGTPLISQDKYPCVLWYSKCHLRVLRRAVPKRRRVQFCAQDELLNPLQRCWVGRGS